MTGRWREDQHRDSTESKTNKVSHLSAFYFEDESEIIDGITLKCRATKPMFRCLIRRHLFLPCDFVFVLQHISELSSELVFINPKIMISRNKWKLIQNHIKKSNSTEQEKLAKQNENKYEKMYVDGNLKKLIPMKTSGDICERWKTPSANFLKRFVHFNEVYWPLPPNVSQTFLLCFRRNLPWTCVTLVRPKNETSRNMKHSARRNLSSLFWDFSTFARLRQFSSVCGHKTRLRLEVFFSPVMRAAEKQKLCKAGEAWHKGNESAWRASEFQDFQVS